MKTKRNDQKKLFILCGLPFSGKTDLAKRIQEKLGGVVVSQDEVFLSLWKRKKGDLEIGDEGPAFWAQAHLESLKEVERALAIGDRVIWDHTNLTRKERLKALSIAEKNGVSAEIVFLDVFCDEIKIRRKQNKITRVRNDIPEWLFQRRLDEMERPSVSEAKLEEIKNFQELEAYIRRL